MNPELVAGIFGVAVITLVFLINAIRKRSTRKEENIAVRPKLVIINEDSKGGPLKIVLYNSGVGAAYIDQIEIILDGLLIPANDKDIVRNVLSRLGLSGYNILCYVPAKDEAIQPEQRCVLIEANPITEREHSEILAALNRLSFKVRYSSANDEKFAVS